jgi:hypothetical protein
MEDDVDLNKLVYYLPYTIEKEDIFLIRYFKLLCNIGTIIFFSISALLIFLLPIIFIIYWANKLLG